MRTLFKKLHTLSSFFLTKRLFGDIIFPSTKKKGDKTMLLTKEDLKKITFGVTDITEEEGTFSFLRFGDTGLSHYTHTAVKFKEKAYATASVKLDFYTDSSFLAFDFTAAPGSSRSYYFFDLYVNDALSEHFGEGNAWLRKGSVRIDLSKYETADGVRRVTLYLPNLANAKLSNIALSDGASITPYIHSRRMLAYGDSITQGYDAEYPSLSYVNRLARTLDACVINLAIGGEKFEPAIIEEHGFLPDLITVAYGTNDWSSGDLTRFEQKCTEFFESLARVYPSVPRFAITPIWRGDADKIAIKVKKPLSYARDFVASTARASGCFVIEGEDLVPHFSGFYYDGRVHPNDLGYADYASGLLREIEPKLNKKGE